LKCLFDNYHYHRPAFIEIASDVIMAIFGKKKYFYQSYCSIW